MFARLSALVLCSVVAACALEQQPPSTSQLPPFFYGTLIDNDIGAINEASYALGSPARTHNDPVEALRAAIAVEYLAGELNTSPRWINMSPLTKMQMLQARDEFRRVLGIKPNAPSQAVVNAEIWAEWALLHGNRAAAEHALSGPIFTLPAPQILAVLTDLPYLPAARSATASAELEEYRNG